MLYTLRSFSLQNAVCFIMLTFFGSCNIHILYTGCAKIKKNNSGAKWLSSLEDSLKMASRGRNMYLSSIVNKTS